MVGFYGGAPLEYEGLGTEAVEASTGGVHAAQFGSFLAANQTPRIFRSTERSAADQDIFARRQRERAEAFRQPGADVVAPTLEPAPQLDPKTANERFGIPGHLSFDQPISEFSARDLYEHKHAELVRQDIIERRAGGVATGAVARLGTGLLAGLLDPLNLAVGLVPIVGEARVAGLLGRGAIEAMGAAERAGVRAIAGGVSGGVGMAALQPVEKVLSLSERDDFTMADALRNIAFGAALGGGLHVVGGAVADRVTGRYANPITQRLEDAGPETRAELLQGAVAQHVADEPVNVARALDLADAVRAERNIGRAAVEAETIHPFARVEIRENRGGGFDVETPLEGVMHADTRAAAEQIANRYRRLPPEAQIAYSDITGRNYAEDWRNNAVDIDAAQRAAEAPPDGPRQRQTQAINELAQRPEPAGETALAATEAAKVGETLPDIERQIAEMETEQGIIPASARPVAAGERAPAEAQGTEPAIGVIPAPPSRLAAFLKREGGLRDETFSRRMPTIRGRAAARANPTDLRSIGAGDVPGLIKARTGMTLDDAALRAWEAGYLPEAGTERATINHLLDALSDDLRGVARYSERDLEAARVHGEALARNAEVDRLSNELGIETRGKSRAQFFDEVRDRLSVEEAARRADSLAAAHETNLAAAERRAQEWTAQRGEAWEPDYHPGRPRTLEELEDAYRQEEAARWTAESSGGAGRAEPAAGSAGTVQAGGGSGGGGAGAGRVVEPASEPTTQGEQLILPGGERSAVQAAQARETAGRGRIASERPQEAPGGLFAEPETAHPELFDLRAVDAEVEIANARAAAYERAAKCIIGGG